ncbi:uncharacterized protein PRCAT00004984001 [Priceomyces carsonii]|uniref:uncharacterized protein n=1 Tax=Priceomyces carsonii TaxID=28549 RepID=UPI002ED83E59|nr:unnamed protein product [Priceomyces carsonii]
MDGASHHSKSQNYQSSITSTVLPSSSLRDILSLVFIFLALPQSLSVILLSVYIVVDEIGSKILFTEFEKHRPWWSVYGLPIWELVRVLVLDFIIYYGFKNLAIKRKELLVHYLIIFATSIIACNLIGTSSISTAVSNRKLNVKIYYENKFVNSSLGHFVMCFLAVNYINYFVSLLSFKSFYSTARHQYDKYYVLLSLHIALSSFHQKLMHSNGKEEVNLNNSYGGDSILTVDLDKQKIPNDPKNRIKNSVAAKNFENFFVHAFNNHNIFIFRAKYNALFNITLQPFWSILAGFKTLIKRPDFFSGKFSKSKNNGGQFIQSPTSTANIAVLLIDESKVIFKFLDGKMVSDKQNLKIKINNVEWRYFKVTKSKDELYVLIHGLTSLFQYEIDIMEDDKILNHFIINTVDNKRVLNESLKDSSTLRTLKISVVSSIKNLTSVKLKLKKLKREEGKKITDLKHNIDNLKGRLSKYNKQTTNEVRAFGKLKGLKHTIIQLESEISLIQKDLDHLIYNESVSKERFDKREGLALQKIQDLKGERENYEERLNLERENLKAARLDLQAMELKHSKLLNKHHTKINENFKLQADLKSLKKNEISLKIQRRAKKVDEKFEVILPKVMHATAELQKDLDKILNE